MEQGASGIIIAMLVVLVFIPALFMGMLNANKQKIKEAMYLSTKALENCVETDDLSLDELSMGYGYSDDPIMRVRIDEPKLFMEFDKLLYMNLPNLNEYKKVKGNIMCEILVYPDRYVIWDQLDPIFSPDLHGVILDSLTPNPDARYQDYLDGKLDLFVSAPKYFTYKQVNFNGDDKLIPIKFGSSTGYYYINTLNDKVRKVGNTNSWRSIDTLITNGKAKITYDNKTDETKTTAEKAITTYDKNQVIIDTLNKEISYYTGGVKVDFINPASVRQGNKKAEKKEFSFFDGITFLVVYREDKFINLSQEDAYNFSQYSVAGYTLEN